MEWLRRGFVALLRLSLLLLLLGLLLVWHRYQDILYAPLDLPVQGQVIRVVEGSSLGKVAGELAALGIVDEAWIFEWYARWRGLAGKIRSGEYHLSRGITMQGLLELLVSGRSLEYSITIPEGWTFRMIREALAGRSELRHILPELDDMGVMEALGLPGVHPEGQFFPDTYSFPRGSTDLSILRRAQHKMQQVLAEEWAGREPDLPLQSPYEALILASIIEKETGRAGERARIAGVFIRRLRKDMKLQTDPTVIYGMGDAYRGNIRRQDLRRDTPYNTYTRKGLTPTPICMPGREAIHAALHPAPGDSLYFVAKGDGSHQFSATLKQHNAAVRKYQLRGK